MDGYCTSKIVFNSNELNLYAFVYIELHNKISSSSSSSFSSSSSSSSSSSF
ncbi:hypothetical protein ACMBCN_00310 [Candidatus Liberibacter asiaticus]